MLIIIMIGSIVKYGNCVKVVVLCFYEFMLDLNLNKDFKIS